MSSKGAQFGRAAPIEPNGLLRVGGKYPTRCINLGTNPNTLENGLIRQVSPEAAFQPGQQVLFYLTVYNNPATPGDQYISRVRLKPWWKRPSEEYRGPGDPGNTQPAAEGWISPDEEQYGSGPVAAVSPTSSVHAENNRLVWFPVVKILDITQYQTPNPPPVAPDRQSDSLFLDDVWTLDLQNPGTVAYAATKGLTQPNYGRSATYLYISHGTALGLTHQFDIAGQGGPAPQLLIDLTWITGTL